MTSFTSVPLPLRRVRRVQIWPAFAAGVTAFCAIALVAYILWPTWPNSAEGSDPDHLPIMVGGALFNVPQNAIRVKVQRHSGVQERIDLAFLFPSLQPPGAPVHVTAATVEDTPPQIDRIFLTLAAHNGAMAPEERLRAIYPRHFDPFSKESAGGLSRQGFRADSPYRDEDLFTADSGFVARCTRDAAIPGMCLSERRLGGADLTFRFPRSWLEQWRDVAGAIDQLSGRLAKAQR